jgi:hypothetical protein
MAVTFTWSISNLERTTEDGGVTVVHWRCDGVDGEAQAGIYGTTECTPDASASDFIAFDSLTQDVVLSWVWNSVVRTDVEAGIADQINAAGLPW